MKACDDFYGYYRYEDEKRRSEFILNSDYKKFLLDKYHTIDEVYEYFNRLHQYDLIQLCELKDDLKQNIKNVPANKNTLLPDNCNHFIANKEMLPKEAFLGYKFTFSHCTIGGIYKVYDFIINNLMMICMLNKGNFFENYSFDGIDKLENPALYSDNKLILSVCTHEHTIALHLTEEQYNDFKKTGIPYIY